MADTSGCTHRDTVAKRTQNVCYFSTLPMTENQGNSGLVSVGQLMPLIAVYNQSSKVISVQPVGDEPQPRPATSNLDDAIEKNYKAALISSRLDKQNIRYAASNGVLTLKGTVKTPRQRQEAQMLATHIPNVKQVVNQIDVRG